MNNYEEFEEYKEYKEYEEYEEYTKMKWNQKRRTKTTATACAPALNRLPLENRMRKNRLHGTSDNENSAVHVYKKLIADVMRFAVITSSSKTVGETWQFSQHGLTSADWQNWRGLA